ncbi:MAG: copper resistance protein CopC [Caldilineaceae bacterium]
MDTNNRRVRRMLAALFAFLWAVGGASLTASAHVIPLRAEPADGAVLASAPPAVRIWFDEAFTPDFSSVRVLDISGAEIAPRAIQRDATDPGLMIVTLPDLTPGVYTVLYKVLAADDGHFTQGQLVFGVGDIVIGDKAMAANSVVANSEPPVAVGEALLRWLNLIGLTGMVGGLTMLLRVVPPTLDYAGHPVERRQKLLTYVRRRIIIWMGWSGLLALAAAGGLLIWQVLSVAPTDGGLPQWGSAAARLLFHTRWGMFWLAQRRGVAVDVVDCMVASPQ